MPPMTEWCFFELQNSVCLLRLIRQANKGRIPSHCYDKINSLSWFHFNRLVLDVVFRFNLL